MRSLFGRPKAKIPESDLRLQDREARIRSLQGKSWKGVWGLAAFLVLSIAAVNEFSFLPALTPELRRLLGASPPITLISIALIVYSFSALILILSRMWSGSGTYRGWSHLAYLAAFYGFYGYGDALDENFLAVFAAGLTILGLESYHIWTWCAEEIEKEKEILSSLNRPGT